MSDETNHSPREDPLRRAGRDGLPGSLPRTRLPTRPIDNLPLELSSFIGREREVAEVERLLSGRRLAVRCAAPGGPGKTRLALAVAQEWSKGSRTGCGGWSLPPSPTRISCHGR